MSLLGNEFDVRCILHGQVSFAAVNHINVLHEVMKGYKGSDPSLYLSVLSDQCHSLLKF